MDQETDEAQRFDAIDGLVFGWIGGVDLLARDLWQQFCPDPVRRDIQRIDI